MNIVKISLKELLANSKTTSQLTELLAQALLETFKESKLNLVVSYHDKVRYNTTDLLPYGMTTHGHEEADTMIPLHVVDIVRRSKLRTIDVWSPDTDVLVLLIGMATNAHLGVLTTLRLLTGKVAKYRAIDVRDRVVALGPEKSRGLIGLHHFTGADWGGKFVGVSKKTIISAYLSLPPEDEIVQTFTNMGNDSHVAEAALKSPWQDGGNIPEMYRPIERFVCNVYSERNGLDILPAPRWELFLKKNLEG